MESTKKPEPSIGEAQRSPTRITDVKALQLRNHGQSLLRVETGSGVWGLGEAGAPAPIVRAHLDDFFKPILLGQDPLQIEKLFTLITRDKSQWQARYVHMPTVSGIDIALWDLAGKILNRSVSELLTGRFRDEIELYVNTSGPEDWLDPSSCRDWAQREKADPCGWHTLKLGFEGLLGKGLPPDRYRGGHISTMLAPSDLRIIRQGYENCRQALGWETDLIVHCHNEWDLPTALGIASAVAPVQPRWLEDAMPVVYSESWKVLQRKSPVRIMTGEKLELFSDFLPFFVNGAVDVVHPDLAFAGGFTGCRKIADLAELYHIPVATHCVGSLVHLLASAHYGASVRNFVMTENRIPQGDLFEEMNGERTHVEDGKLSLPKGPGLGIRLVPEVIKENLAEGETYWD